MIKQYTILNVADNSGARKVRCIQVIGKNNQLDSKIGDIIVVTVKDAIPQATVKKKSVVKAVIVRQRGKFIRPNGTSIKFDDNAVVIIDDEKNPKGTRILGPVARELRVLGFNKIISLAPEVL